MTSNPPHRPAASATKPIAPPLVTATAGAAASTTAPTDKAPQVRLPEVSIEHTDPGEDTRTRPGVIQAKQYLESHRVQTFKETRGMPACPEKNALYKAMRACQEEKELLERHLEEHFVPQHGPAQFLSPRAFFVSLLFRVRRKTLVREKHVELLLPTSYGKPTIHYKGPELRQSDGLVFLALVHMLRDVQAGTAVSLQPEAMCRALFGRYDGNARRQLREHIQRLQQGLLIFESFSVQLCLRFDYPRTGRWTVALDRHITGLFRVSPATWFALQDRLLLPDGLATWLYTYVASQTRLIPMKLATLRELCGSDASDKGFANRFRDAMRHLAERGVVDTGWSIEQGQVHWRKGRVSEDASL